MDEQRPHPVRGVRRHLGFNRRTTTLLPILVALGLLVLFFYYPLASLMGRAVWNGGRIDLSPLLNVFRTPYLRHVILFTVEQALLSTALSVLIGFPMAYFLARIDFPGRRVLRSLTAVPFALPAITVALGFVMVFGNNGAVNRLIMSMLGLSNPPLPILYSVGGIVLAHAFYNAPIVARFVASTWERLPRTYEESARSMGAARGRVFWDVTLPMLVPSLASGAMLAFIYSFLSFPIVLILGGAQFTTVEVEIYRRAIVEINYTAAAALATWELLIALAFTYAYLQLERRFGRRVRPDRPRTAMSLFGKRKRKVATSAEPDDNPTPVPLERRTGVRRAWGVYVIVLLYFVFFLGPLVGVLVDSFTRLDAGRSTFTLDWYRQVFQPRYSSLIAASPLRSIENSLIFALSSMGLSLAAGTVLAAALTIRRFPARSAVETLIMAPVGISPVALGFAYLWIFARPPFRLTGTPAAIIIVHSVLAIPFVVRSLRPALARIELQFAEAARSLGATTYRQTLDIVLPLSRSAFTTAAVFAFAVSIAETSATIMLTKPNLLTMPVAVYYLLSGRQFGAASAMGVLLILVIALSFVLIERFGERAVGGVHDGD